MINAEIKIGGRIYQSTGISILEAIGALPVGNAKGRGILSISKDGVVKTKIIPMQKVVQLFGKGSPNIKAVILKQTCLLFDKNLFEQ